MGNIKSKNTNPLEKSLSETERQQIAEKRLAKLDKPVVKSSRIHVQPSRNMDNIVRDWQN